LSWSHKATEEQSDKMTADKKEYLWSTTQRCVVTLIDDIHILGAIVWKEEKAR
jgi:hypothetical protein